MQQYSPRSCHIFVQVLTCTLLAMFFVVVVIENQVLGHATWMVWEDVDWLVCWEPKPCIKKGF